MTSMKGIFFALVALATVEVRAGELNQLANEESVYLRQHANNPVQWYPWGEEAFAKAKAENKLILLSVGYSTCHWCHVMERESFQNVEIAKKLNESFVCIKLDREERPDVDAVYMRAYQAVSGQGGGWPLNVFLTPELKFVTGATYLPPVEKDGLPGFGAVAERIAEAWSKDGEAMAEQAAEMQEQMAEFFAAAESTGKIVNVSAVAEVMMASADREHGGFGTGEKFPQVSSLRLLQRVGNAEQKKFVADTVRIVARGGIYDHVGGGIHRYTVDREWQVPHFEKMLYDQAMWLDLCVERFVTTGDKTAERMAREIADFVLHEMRTESGAFGSALDAQSEGKEGKFYCWTEAELKQLLTEEEFQLVSEHFDISAKGNFFDFSDPEALKEQNVLAYLPGKSWSPAVGKLLAKLGAVREKRVRPRFDPGVQAGWNGLMIGALARAGRVLEEPRYLKAAQAAHRSVVASLWDADKGTLAHISPERSAAVVEHGGSYGAYLVSLKALYEASLDEQYLTLAVAMMESYVARFYDESGGGFYETALRDDVVLRLKGDFDGAVPTASSTGYIAAKWLAQVTGREDFAGVAEATAKHHLGVEADAAVAFPEMLAAFAVSDQKAARLVIVGDEGREEMLTIAHKHGLPGMIVMGNSGPVAEFERGLKPTGGKATAFFCVGTTCELPVTDSRALAEKLREKSGKKSLKSF